MHNPGEMNSERHYFALIGDIIDSRHEQDRYDVQKKLQSILSSVNAEHAAHIAADFLITLGDEFQGLLFAEKGADPIFVADRIIDEMFPVRIRIAIGFGGMATQIRREAAIGADGEAFYRARHGMNTAAEHIQEFCLTPEARNVRTAIGMRGGRSLKPA